VYETITRASEIQSPLDELLKRVAGTEDGDKNCRRGQLDEARPCLGEGTGALPEVPTKDVVAMAIAAAPHSQTQKPIQNQQVNCYSLGILRAGRAFSLLSTSFKAQLNYCNLALKIGSLRNGQLTHLLCP
jgi:hypothetical protein